MVFESNRQYMDQVFNEYARIGKPLSSEKRLEILHRLIHGARTVEQIARISNMTVANTSRHLQVLKESSLVTIEKDGKYIYYSVSSDKIEHLLNDIHLISQEQSPMLRQIEQEFIFTDSDIRTLALEDAQSMVSDQRAQLVDLRSEMEFEVEHINGAVNIPFDALDDHLEDLQKEKAVILYCRGLFCPYTNQAASFLNKNGFDAYSVNATHFDWKRLDSDSEREPI